MNNLTQRLQLYWNIRWLKRTTIGALATALILLLTPVAIQFGLTHWLIKQGASDARIDDINFNPFAGSFEMTQLQYQAAEYPPARVNKFAVNLAMLDLLSGHIVISDLSISGLQADMTRNADNSLSVNGLTIKPATNDQMTPTRQSEPLPFGLQRLSVVDSKIHYQESQLQQQLEIATLNLSNIKTWDKASLAALQADMTLNTGGIQLDIEMQLFDQLKRITGSLQIANIEASDYHKFYPAALTQLSAQLMLDSRFEITLGDTLSAQIDNKLTLSDLTAHYNHLQPSLAQLQIAGKTRIDHIAPQQIASLFDPTFQAEPEQALNLFSGQLELAQLTLTDQQGKQSKVDHLRIDVNQLDLLAARYEIDQIDVSGLQSSIRRDDKGIIHIDGIALEPSQEPTQTVDKTEKSTPSPEFSVQHLQIRQADIQYTEGDFAQRNHIDEIRLSDIRSWNKTLPASLKLQAKLNDAPVTLQAKLLLFDEPRKITGKISLQQLSAEQYQKFTRPWLDDISTRIDFNADFDVTLNEQLSARISHQLQSQQLKLTKHDIRLQADQIDWKGIAEIEQNRLTSLSGDLTIDTLQSDDSKQNYQIATIDRLSVQGFRYQPQQLQIAQLSLHDSRFLSKKQLSQFVALKSLSINDLAFNPTQNALSMQQLSLQKPQIHTTLNQQKQLQELSPLLQTIDRLSPPKAAEKKPGKGATPLKINIGRIALKQRGAIDFTDHSVSPLYKTRIELDRIDIQQLARDQDGQFDIALRQDQYSRLDLKGDGRLMDPTQKLELTAKIRQLDLPPLTPYSSKMMGYGMKSGVVDSDIKLKLKQRNIDALIKLDIDSIEVIETDTKTAEQVASAAGMSLDLAISSLKDKNNVIDLTLPVKGNIDEPDFDLSLVINKAMGKAMKAATLSYLKTTLQPFGSLITLYSLAKAAADHISLPPLLFEPGSTEYQPDQQKLLSKVIKVLHERPGLKIKACGISTLADKKAITQQLIDAEFARLKASQQQQQQADQKKVLKPLQRDSIEVDEQLVLQKMKQLADARSARVKDDFLKQGKLEPKRILNCLSNSSDKKESKPAVELML